MKRLRFSARKLGNPSRPEKEPFGHCPHATIHLYSGTCSEMEARTKDPSQSEKARFCPKSVTLSEMEVVGQGRGRVGGKAAERDSSHQFRVTVRPRLLV